MKDELSTEMLLKAFTTDIMYIHILLAEVGISFKIYLRSSIIGAE